MRTISPKEALNNETYIIVTVRNPVRVYGRYSSEDEANRICEDLNARYNNGYEVATVDFNINTANMPIDNTGDDYWENEIKKVFNRFYPIYDRPLPVDVAELIISRINDIQKERDTLFEKLIKVKTPDTTVFDESDKTEE